MSQLPDGREHFNLYHIFAEDKAAHPPDEQRMESIRRLLIKMTSK